jgi:integrase
MGQGRVTLGAFLVEQWLPAITTSVRKTTLASYTSHVRHHLCPRLGNVLLSELEPSAINRFYAYLLSAGRRDGLGGLSPVTVRRIHATLHRALRDAVKWGLLDTNPASRCDPPRARADDVAELHTWEPDEVRAFLEFTCGTRLAPLWHLLVMTGLRRGEALGLRWADIDLARKTLVVRQTVVTIGYEIHVSRPKSAKGRRVVALDDDCVRVLSAHRARHPNANPDDFVFSLDDGSPLHPIKVSKAFKRLVRKSGLPKIRLHDLRHTHATMALQAGIHPKIVSERLGHSTIALTLDIYSHALQHMQHEAVEAIAKLIR